MNKSEDKTKKKNKVKTNSVQSKNLKFEKNIEKNKFREKNKLDKEKFSPITSRAKQMSNLEKKERYTFKTLESNDKLITRKPKNIIEADEKKIKSKKILSLNYDITPLNKYYKTELSFKNTTNILLKDNKLEKKSFNN